MQNLFHGASVTGADDDQGRMVSAASFAVSDERKYITILVADLQQSTQLVSGLDPEEAVDRLDPALAIMREAVRRHGGITSRELGDGVKALFGAPRSDEKHAARACYAGIEITNRIAQLNDPAIQVRVGIHSDYVVTRFTRNDYSSVYDATGPAAHLADRLQSAARPGEILISASCQALCEGLIVFEALEPKELKGFSQPVALARVTGVSTLSRWRTRSQRSLPKFVGRAHETTILEHAASEVRPGSGQVVMLVGDPGIGKSRVAHEFLNDLRQKEWRVIEVECSPIRTAIPYGTIKDLLLAIYPQLQGSDAAVREWVQNSGLELPEYWDSALATILDRPLSIAAWNELAIAQRRIRIAETFRSFIAHLAISRPVAVLVEDLHWADIASSTALEALAEFVERHQLLMIMTSRPYAVRDWRRFRNMRSVMLGPLSPEAGDQFLDALLGPAPQLAELKTQVLRHTGGVPLFIEEVVRHLMDNGKLVGSWGNFDWLTSSRELGVPPSVQGAIAERIDRLGHNEKSTLLAGSAVGPRVALSILESVTKLPQSLLRACLQSLDAAGLLLERPMAAAPEYEFSHDLVREVAYGMLLTRDKERLHGAILSTLEADAEARANVVEALSHHALKARDWSKAASYTQLSAQRSLSRSALHEAAEYFELAADAVDHLPFSVHREELAIDLRLEARHAFPATGNFEAWMRFSTEAVERSRALNDAPREVSALVAKAAAANFHGSLREAIECSSIAVRRAELLGAPGWLSVAEYGLGQAMLTAGLSRQAASSFGRAIARLSGPVSEMPTGTTAPHLSLLCCMMKSVAHAAMGEHGSARAFQRRASTLATMSGRPYDLIAASYGQGYYFLRWDHHAKACSSLKRAMDLSLQHDIRQFVPVISCLLGKAYLEQGHLIEARDALLGARAEAEKVGHTLAGLRSCAYLAQTLGSLGDVTGALELARSITAVAAKEGFEGVTAEALLSEASVLTFACGPSTLIAEQRLTEAMSIAGRIEARPLLAAAKALLGELRLQAGETSEAIGILGEAAELYREMRMSKQLKRIGSALQRQGVPCNSFGRTT